MPKTVQFQSLAETVADYSMYNSQQVWFRFLDFTLRW